MNIFGLKISRNINSDRYTQPLQVVDGNFMNGYTNWLMANNDDIKQFISVETNEYQLYKTTSELRQVIDKGAYLFSNGSWKLYDLENNEIESHEVLDLLKKPNILQSKNEYLITVYLHFALSGNSFTYVNRAFKNAIPSSLMPLPYNLISLIRSKKYIKQIALSNVIKRYELANPQDRSKIIDTFDIDEILHLKNHNPLDLLVGESPLESLHMPISNIRSGYGYVNADYTKKGALGILSPKGNKDGAGSAPIPANQISTLEKRMSEYAYGTSDEQNKIYIANIPTEYTPVSSAIKDHLVFESNEVYFKRIIDAYSLNESLFSFMRQSTFNNKENGEKQSYQNGIIPIADLFSSEINDKLNLPKKGLKVKLDYSHVSCFKEDENEKAETLLKRVDAYSKLISSGVSEENALKIAGFEDLI